MDSLPLELACEIYEAVASSQQQSAHGVVVFGSSCGASRDLAGLHAAREIVWSNETEECCIVVHQHLSLRWSLRRVCKLLRECVDRAGWADGLSTSSKSPPIFVVNPIIGVEERLNIQVPGWSWHIKTY